MQSEIEIKRGAPSSPKPKSDVLKTTRKTTMFQELKNHKNSNLINIYIDHQERHR